MYRSALALVLLAVACGSDASGDATPAAAPGPAQPEASPDAEPAAAATPEPTPEPEPVVPAARPTEAADFDGHHILVRAGSRLRMGAGPDAPELTLSLPEPDADPVPSIAMRVVGHEDGRLRVRAPVAAERCGEGLQALGTFDLTFSVSPSAAARVLARPFEAKFRDGTRVTLRPGVAVGDEGEKIAVDASGIGLALEIPETEIGTYYDPDPNEAPLEQAQTLALGKRLFVDGEPISPQSALYGAASYGRPAVLATSEVGGTTYTRVGNRCATFEAKTTDADDAAEEARLAAMAGHGAFGILGSSGMDSTYSVEPGAKVYWADGSEAGEVLAAHTFEHYQVEKNGKGKRCFSQSLDPDVSSASMTLCFARKDVQEHASPFAALMAPPTLGAGFGSAGIVGTLGTEEDVWGGLTGTEIGEEFGAGGLGLSGTGRGGGGTGAGTIALGGGGLGTKGGGAGYGVGSKTASPKAKSSISTKVTGELAKDVVERVVKRMSNQLRYCYERELTADPTLEGTVTVSATIGSGGTVSATSSSGPKDVAACMERVVKRAAFPTGSGITIATVTAKLSSK
mgnify:CR=1 FL=1